MAEPRTGLLQEGGLFLRARPAQDGVAVGEAAKAIDDHLVAAGKVGKAFEGGPGRACGLLVGQRLEQGDASGLLLSGLRVLEGQIEEDPGQRREPLVDPEGEPLEAQRPGLVVLGEGGGGVAVKVSRQLVQQQDEGQAPCGIVLPTGELARCGTGRQFAEA